MKIPDVIKSLLVCTIALALVAHVHALETATHSADPSAVTENLKNRLKETINEVTADDASSTVGYIGQVKDIVKNTLVVEDKSGKRNVIVDDNTHIIRSPGNAAIKLENVKIGDSVIAMGVPDTANNTETQGKRIIVSDTPFNPPDKIVGLATVTKLTSSSIGLVSPTDSKSVTLAVTSKTVVKTPNETLDFTNLQVNDLVIYSALVDSKDSNKVTATVIMKIKGQGPSAATPVVSPSPSVKASPSPKSSPKASSPGRVSPPPIY
jgi:RNase P/RNase MRP subunit p29